MVSPGLATFLLRAFRPLQGPISFHRWSLPWATTPGLGAERPRQESLILSTFQVLAPVRILADFPAPSAVQPALMESIRFPLLTVRRSLLTVKRSLLLTAAAAWRCLPWRYRPRRMRQVHLLCSQTFQPANLRIMTDALRHLVDREEAGRGFPIPLGFPLASPPLMGAHFLIQLAETFVLMRWLGTRRTRYF